jgi:hypothetical protein
MPTSGAFSGIPNNVGRSIFAFYSPIVNSFSSACQDVLVVVSLTRGFCCTCPVAAIRLIPIGKEIERRSQEGEDISVLDNVGPVRYSPRKTANTRPADAALIQRASRFPKKLLRRESGVSQHAIAAY